MKKIVLPQRHRDTVKNNIFHFSTTLCRHAAVAIIFLFAPQFLSSQEISQSLNSNWQFSEAGKNEWLAATVPGTIHTDLLANKKIPDPYIGTNESKVQWVETKTWEYKTTFNVDVNLLKCKHEELVFDGLDTYAFVYLNDSLILTGENMFLSYRVDVTRILKKQNNIMRIVFHPASELIAINKEKSDIKNLPGGDRVFIRKAQYQFGWDFGPRLVTCGIWKNVKLVGWNQLAIAEATIQTINIKNDIAYMMVNIPTRGFGYANEKTQIIVTEGKDILLDYEIGPCSNCTKDEKWNYEFNYFQIPFEIYHPKLWWCNGIGNPVLHHFKLSLQIGKWKQDTIITTGIRTVQLIQSAESKDSSFYFLLNGEPVFIRGANWIPCDNFLPRVTSEKYYSLIKTAQQSNMNMLRVWGGGIYEDEKFYNLCDSLGLMVWQDFMFACAMYPGDNHFLSEIKAEAQENILRLQNHPCISLWCGNNENMEGWKNWEWQKEFNYNKEEAGLILSNYNQVFDSDFGLLNKTLKEIYFNPYADTNYQPFYSYYSSSPSTGWGHPEAYKSGDVHYWGVWWGNEPFSSYDNHVGIFMSEYGFQALPQLSTFKLFDSEQNISLSDSSILEHQKNENGFEKINSYMQNDYPVATDFSDFKNDSDFADYIYISQVLQRDGISRAINDHRRVEPFCMGTMFWQFNDCWPGITWSSTDYYGQPKLLQYALKDLYAPLLISVLEKNDSVFIYVMNDDTIPHKGILGLHWMSFNGMDKRQNISQATVPAGSSMMILGFEKKLLFDVLAPEKGVLKLFFSYEGGKNLATEYYFTNTKSLALEKDPGLVMDISPTKNANGSYTLTLRTISLAKNIYFSIDDTSTKFSDNGFDYLPYERKDILIYTSLSLEDLKKRLKIQTMNDFRE